MDHPPIQDAEGRELRDGDSVRLAGSRSYGHAGIVDQDENGWGVRVVEEGARCGGEHEVYSTIAPNLRAAWGGDETLRCDEVVLADGSYQVSRYSPAYRGGREPIVSMAAGTVMEVRRLLRLVFGDGRSLFDLTEDGYPPAEDDIAEIGPARFFTVDDDTVVVEAVR